MAQQTGDATYSKHVRAFDMSNGITYIGSPVEERSLGTCTRYKKGKPLEMIIIKEWVQCPTASLVT